MQIEMYTEYFRNNMKMIYQLWLTGFNMMFSKIAELILYFLEKNFFMNFTAEKQFSRKSQKHHKNTAYWTQNVTSFQ